MAAALLGLAAGGAALAGAAGSPAAFGPAANGAPLAALPVASGALQARDTVFRHADHRSVDCVACHSMDPVHGDLRVRTLSDCRACHHAEPLASDCAACHVGEGGAPERLFEMVRAPAFSVGTGPARPLPFLHEEHREVGCLSCHTEGLALSAREVSCASCHEEHHRPEARCTSCHLPVLGPPHEVEVHVGCTGSGCHTDLPFEGVPRTRGLCLTCHQEMETHRPGRECTACHLLPPARGPGGAP